MIKNATAALLLALVPMFAQADNYLSPTEERVRVSLGIMQLSSSTDIQLDSHQGVTGTPIDAERDLGLGSSNIEPKFQAMVRVDERNRLRFDYFTLDRTGRTTIEDSPIIFRDVVLLPGDPVQSSVSMRTFSISYGYSFLHSDRYEVAATIGINDTDISARSRVATETRHVDQSEDQAGPFPTIGLDATYVLSKRFYIDGRLQYFRLSVNDLDGSLGFYEVDALYRFRPNVSFALGYNAVKVNIVSRQASSGGSFDFDSKGPELFVRVAF